MFPGVSLLKLFAVMEAELDLNRFVAGDVHLWPIARACFGSKKIDNNTAPDARSAELKRVDDAIEARYQRLIASDPPRADRPASVFHADKLLGSGDRILVFSRGEDHQLQTPHGYYAPIIDPWVELAASRGHCEKVEVPNPRLVATQPRARATETLQLPDIDRSRIGQLEDLRRSAHILALTITKWLEQTLAFSYPGYPADLDGYLTGLWVEKEQISLVLAARKPRLVLATCTYYRPTFAATWAARERGIAMADVQHGGNGPFHMGYTHWRGVPPDGYRACPNLFFTWDAISANNIVRWLPQNAGATVVVTGRFDLDATRRAYLGDTTTSPLDLVTQGSGKTVLVTLQWLPSTGLTPLLLDAMKKAPSDWTWLVRSHPMAVAWNRTELMPEAIEATLRANGIMRAESRFTTALPLAVILPLVDHHVTGFSGTVQECAAYGIPTTFTHGAARFSFPSYIDTGVADFATDADDLLNRIAGATKRSALNDMPRDPSVALRALDRLLS